MRENPHKTPTEPSKQKSPSIDRRRADVFRLLSISQAILGVIIACFSAMYPINMPNLIAVASIFVIATWAALRSRHYAEKDRHDSGESSSPSHPA